MGNLNIPGLRCGSLVECSATGPIPSTKKKEPFPATQRRRLVICSRDGSTFGYG